MIQVRRARSTDAEAISALSAEVQAHHASALPTLFKPASPGTFPASEVQVLLEGPNRVFLVACLDGRVVGYASAQLQQRSETAFRFARETLCVQWMGVGISARRQGVGRALLGTIRLEARERGIPSIELDVWAFNVGARAFYEAMGFRAHRTILSFDDVSPQPPN